MVYDLGLLIFFFSVPLNLLVPLRANTITSKAMITSSSNFSYLVIDTGLFVANLVITVLSKPGYDTDIGDD